MYEKILAPLDGSELADEIYADVVAMSTHGESGIGRWVFGSVADKVLHGGNTPLLLVRAPGALRSSTSPKLQRLLSSLL